MRSNRLSIEYLAINAFRLPERKLRKHPQGQIRKIMASIERFGMNVPILIDGMNEVLAGAATIEACRKLGFDELPAVRITHLDDAEKRLFRIAHNRIAEDASWDTNELKLELQEIAIDTPDIDLTLSGISITEVDRLIGNIDGDLSDLDQPVDPEMLGSAVTQAGDLWRIGEHRLLCGNACKADDVVGLMEGEEARVWLTDPPYNVPISGHVSGLGKHQHREFAMAAGEMSAREFEAFLGQAIGAASDHLTEGGLFYIFMDARHLIDLQLAARDQLLETLNLCVWVKDNGGMGSFYRSQHELVLVAKRAADREPHINTIELGKNGRYRTNVWSYAGVNSFGEGRDAALAIHPTVKPVSLLADAILDCSKPGEIVLDSFGGSGSTMVAAEKTGRRARLLELDPHYCDAIIERMQRAFGLQAKHARTGQFFAELDSERTEQGRVPFEPERQRETCDE